MNFFGGVFRIIGEYERRLTNKTKVEKRGRSILLNPLYANCTHTIFFLFFLFFAFCYFDLPTKLEIRLKLKSKCCKRDKRGNTDKPIPTSCKLLSFI